MALTAGRTTKRMGDSAHPDILSFPIADNVHIFNGSLVGLNSAGYVIPASASCIKIVGCAERDYDNTVLGHAAGALDVRIRQGTFQWANGSGVQALTVADEGKLCYAADDQTVQKGDAAGTLPVAGTVVLVETTGVWVTSMLFDLDPTILTLPAADNFAAAPNLAITVYNDSGVAKAKTATAGDAAIGVLQNTPVAGGIARVKVLGPSVAYASGTINVGEQVAADTSGKLKKASPLAVASANANGSFVLGVALTAGSTSNAFQVFICTRAAAPTVGV
jgi:hypothetical protein